MPMPSRFPEIAAHYRQQIINGTLKKGDRLPPLKNLAEQWQVAVETVRKALAQLVTEGLITMGPRGTFVAGWESTSSGLDRFVRSRKNGSILSDDETAHVHSAGIVIPPTYVADLFDLEDDPRVIRREFIISRANQRLALCVTWYPLHFQDVPGILDKGPQEAGAMSQLVLAHSGRIPKGWRDDMHARETDHREAAALGLRPGSPTFALVTRIWDDLGLIEYTETCLAPRQTIGYESHFGQ